MLKAYSFIGGGEGIGELEEKKLTKEYDMIWSNKINIVKLWKIKCGERLDEENIELKVGGGILLLGWH